MHVLSLFRENAADLAAVSSEPDYDDTSGVKEESTDSKAYLLAQRPVAAPERDRAKFPDHMAHFARELDAFRTALNEYHEFRDDSFNKAVLALKRRVEVCHRMRRILCVCGSDLLPAYSIKAHACRSLKVRYLGSVEMQKLMFRYAENDNFKAPAVQLFIYDMSVEIGTRMANIASFLPGLTDGNPSIIDCTAYQSILIVAPDCRRRCCVVLTKPFDPKPSEPRNCRDLLFGRNCDYTPVLVWRKRYKPRTRRQLVLVHLASAQHRSRSERPPRGDVEAVNAVSSPTCPIEEQFLMVTQPISCRARPLVGAHLAQALPTLFPRHLHCLFLLRPRPFRLLFQPSKHLP